MFGLSIDRHMVMHSYNAETSGGKSRVVNCERSVL